MKMSKLKSRKFWIAIISAALLVAKDGLGIEVDNETVMAFAGIVITWIIGEAAVDAKRAKTPAVTEEGNSDEESTTTIGNNK